VLSEDGRRFASISNHLVSFGELPSGRSLGSARMGTDGWLTGAFVSPGRFRAWEKREQELRIAEFDVDRRALAAPVSIGPFSDFFVFLPDASGSRVLVRDSGAHRTRMRLFDLRDGAARATIFDGPGASATSARFLADGRIVLASTGPGGPSLRLFDAGGSPRPAIALPSARRIQVGGEPAPGVVLVALRDTDVSAPWDAARLLLVDVDRGTARTVATDLAPAGWPFFFGPMAGRSSVSLFYGPGGSLVRFDPITGERRTILAGHGNR
jgi:hypothetical protein